MTDRVGLLDYAEQVLDGTVELRSSGPRTAALLARCALEEWLDEQSASWTSEHYPFPTTISKLVALDALGEGDLGLRARRLWDALSRSAHHHAYELQPSLDEVRLLIEKVRALGW